MGVQKYGYEFKRTKVWGRIFVKKGLNDLNIHLKPAANTQTDLGNVVFIGIYLKPT